MSEKESPIELQLYVVCGSGYLKSPIRFTEYPSHIPRSTLESDINSIFHLPNDMRTSKTKKLYHLNNKNFLDEERTYKQQKVKGGDSVVLTDYTDMDLLEAVIRSIIPPTIKSNQERRIKTVIRGFLKGIPWVGPGFDALIFGKDKN